MTKLNRRAMLAGAGASLAGAAVTAAVIFPSSADGAEIEIADPEIDGLTGLTLAAVHIERAVAAMASVKMGRWSVKIHSGQPDQYWAFHQESNLVRRAICKHRRLDAEKEAVLQARDAIDIVLDNNPWYDCSPKVQVGQHVRGFGRDDAPIYAYDVAEIERHSAKWQGVGTSLYRPEMAEAYKTKFAEKRRDLERQIRRKKRIERRAGLPQAQKAVDAAYRAEELAAMAVILSRPANAAERAEKAAYMRGKACFKVNYWDVEALFTTLIENSEGLVQ